MAKAAQQSQEKEVTGERMPLILDQTQDETPDETALYNLITELESDGTGAKVSIWRVNEQITGRGAGKDTYLTAMSPSDFAQYGLDGIQQDYGEGKYRVKINQPNGTLAMNRIFPIGPLPKSRQAPSVQFQPQQREPSNGDAGMAALIATMQQGFQGLAQILVNQSANNETAMLTKLQAYKSLFSGGPVQTAPQGDPFSMMKSALELVKEFGPGGGESKSVGDVFIKLAEEFAPAIAAVATARAQPQRLPMPTQQPQQPQQPQPNAAPNVPVLFPPQQEQQMSPLEIQLKMILPTMVAQAAQGNDSYKYADMVLDFVDVTTAESIASRPDWFEWLASLNQNVRQFEPWFRGFHTHLIQIIAQEKQAEIAPPLTNDDVSGFNAFGAPDNVGE